VFEQDNGAVVSDKKEDVVALKKKRRDKQKKMCQTKKLFLFVKQKLFSVPGN
jgi:hypothetical protein